VADSLFHFRRPILRCRRPIGSAAQRTNDGTKSEIHRADAEDVGIDDDADQVVIGRPECRREIALFLTGGVALRSAAV
jgi:hypothetical protein